MELPEIPIDIRAKAGEAVKGRYAKGHREALVADVARALLAERLSATERAAKIAEDRAPATQDMNSTFICEVCDEIAAAIRSQP